MLRGQKPKNRDLKLVTGNPGKRPVNDAEPTPAGEVRKPTFVKGKAARLWRQYAPDLEAKGVLTSWDVDMFGVWCVLMADFQKSPELFNTARLTQLRTLGESFGLLPPGRARLKTSKSGEAKDDRTQFYA